MMVGYARISTVEQTIDYQKELLTKEGCERIFEDVASGAKSDRPGLDQALEYVREGDTLVVWKLDRLGRSLVHLINTVKRLEDKGVNFRSMTEYIDTGTSGGRLIFHIMGSLAQFERDIIIERTNAGLLHARARGIKGGRPFKLATKSVEALKKLYEERDKDGIHVYSISELCKTFKISEPSLYRYIHRKEDE